MSSAITIPPTPSSLTSNSAMFGMAILNPKQRLAILVQAKMVLLNYKGGKNYIGNHTQLTIDTEAAFLGATPESWAATSGQTDQDVDPGPYTVGQFWQQANFRDSVNMPATLASVVPLLVLQMARTGIVLQKQNVYLDFLLLGRWG